MPGRAMSQSFHKWVPSLKAQQSTSLLACPTKRGSVHSWKMFWQVRSRLSASSRSTTLFRQQRRAVRRLTIKLSRQRGHRNRPRVERRHHFTSLIYPNHIDQFAEPKSAKAASTYRTGALQAQPSLVVYADAPFHRSKDPQDTE